MKYKTYICPKIITYDNKTFLIKCPYCEKTHTYYNIRETRTILTPCEKQCTILEENITVIKSQSNKAIIQNRLNAI